MVYKLALIRKSSSLAFDALSFEDADIIFFSTLRSRCKMLISSDVRYASENILLKRQCKRILFHCSYPAWRVHAEQLYIAYANTFWMQFITEHVHCDFSRAGKSLSKSCQIMLTLAEDSVELTVYQGLQWPFIHRLSFCQHFQAPFPKATGPMSSWVRCKS